MVTFHALPAGLMVSEEAPHEFLVGVAGEGQDGFGAPEGGVLRGEVVLDTPFEEGNLVADGARK